MTRLRLDPTPPRRPAGGFIYNDPSGVNLVEPDYPQKLIEKLVQFRLNNNLPAGDPEHDIALQFKSKGWGYLLKSERAVSEEPPRSVNDQRSEAILHWIQQIWRDPPKKLFSEKQAQPRGKTCLACPHFERWEAIDEAELDAVRRMAILSRGALLDNQGYCRHHKWQTGLACVIEEHPTERVAQAPPECWLSREHAAQP